VIPVLSVAVAATFTVPETVAPEVGELMETVGGVVLALLTVSETVALLAV
jgi:hypothetical protein